MTPRSIIGNFLILSALFLLAYIYMPIVMIYIPGIPQPEIEPTEYSIEIPKINAIAPIIANVDPWKQDAYSEPLKKGVAQAKGFADFGQTGTIFLFAHSSLPPWDMTRANTAFLRLDDLKLGDEIVIKKFGETYTYKVVDKLKVWPDDTKGLREEKGNQLILQTCIPLGTDLQRLLVFAKPIDELE